MTEWSEGMEAQVRRQSMETVIQLLMSSKTLLSMAERDPGPDFVGWIFATWQKYYPPEPLVYDLVFTPADREVLARFDEAMQKAQHRLGSAYPSPAAFVKTRTWRRLRRRASQCWKRLSKSERYPRT